MQDAVCIQSPKYCEQRYLLLGAVSRRRAKYHGAEVRTAVCGVESTCLRRLSQINTCRARCGGNVLNIVEQNFHMQDAVCIRSPKYG